MGNTLPNDSWNLGGSTHTGSVSRLLAWFCAKLCLQTKTLIFNVLLIFAATNQRRDFWESPPCFDGTDEEFISKFKPKTDGPWTHKTNIFCLALCSFPTKVLDLETPECLARAQVIDCPEYPSDQPYEVSFFSENPTCFKNANVANPLVSALGSDFFWARFQGNSIDRTAASGLEKHHTCPKKHKKTSVCIRDIKKTKKKHLGEVSYTPLLD